MQPTDHFGDCCGLRRAEANRYPKVNVEYRKRDSDAGKASSSAGGPRFEHAGRIPLYHEDELDTWAQFILSPLKSSTSDPASGGDARD
jgi:hypothetical protein